MQGSHPAGSEVSVLQHPLGEHRTVPEDRGLFPERTYRLHPDVCAYISEAFYEGRLVHDPSTEERTMPFGTGIRYLPVEHEAQRQDSPEEAARVRAEVVLYSTTSSRARTSRAGSTSSSPATASTTRSRAPAVSRTWSRARACSRWRRRRSSRCGWRTPSACSWRWPRDRADSRGVRLPFRLHHETERDCPTRPQPAPGQGGKTMRLCKEQDR